MKIIDSLLVTLDKNEREAKTAREACINIMDSCQAAFDTIAELQLYIDAPNIEVDKDIHLTGQLSGKNSIEGAYLQVIIDKKN